MLVYLNKKDEKLDMRQYKSRYILEKGKNNILATFISKKILRSKSYAKEYQYLMNWQKYNDTTWISADNLNCIDLIDAYEIKNSNM
jgi:hypothetical protein